MPVVKQEESEMKYPSTVYTCRHFAYSNHITGKKEKKCIRKTRDKRCSVDLYDCEIIKYRKVKT